MVLNFICSLALLFLQVVLICHLFFLCLFSFLPIHSMFVQISMMVLFCYSSSKQWVFLGTYLWEIHEEDSHSLSTKLKRLFLFCVWILFSAFNSSKLRDMGRCEIFLNIMTSHCYRGMVFLQKWISDLLLFPLFLKDFCAYVHGGYWETG